MYILPVQIVKFRRSGQPGVLSILVSLVSPAVLVIIVSLRSGGLFAISILKRVYLSIDR